MHGKILDIYLKEGMTKLNPCSSHLCNAEKNSLYIILKILKLCMHAFLLS